MYSKSLVLVLLFSLTLISCSATVAQRQQQQSSLDSARYWYRQGDLVSAEQQLNRLHRQLLATAESWRLLGNIHFRQQRLAAAESAYREALELAPSDRKSWHNLAITQLRRTTSSLMLARVKLGQLDPQDRQLLDTLLQLQRAQLP